MIAVLGATGQIGSLVAEELARRGVDARALVRRPSNTAVPLDAVRADLTDPSSLGPALRGATRLLLVTPHHADQDLLEATAIEAAAAAGVERIVKISGGSASLGPNGTTRTSVAHWRSEQRIERSGMGFTFLRPS
ncbi:MAG: NAD(P)H-binding protein, partial [Solirubrobacteraceae bacterium]|nr:NAD(P)H-binding protein [Solirubrobacteraceae bacterium]